MRTNDKGLSEQVESFLVWQAENLVWSGADEEDQMRHQKLLMLQEFPSPPQSLTNIGVTCIIRTSSGAVVLLLAETCPLLW